MSPERFRELVEDAIDSIPERFARQIRNVGYIIEDEPSDDLLDEMEVEDGDTLFGLYQGTPLTERPWDHGNQLPDCILLFRHPIEDDGDGSEDDVFDCIGQTLIHEIGHYFGMTEEQIDVVEEMWRQGDAADTPEPGGNESA
jgi:predicted Zn-dependent protease with MMP-like domain